MTGAESQVAEAVAIGKWLIAFGLIFGIYLKIRAWEKSMKPGADKLELKEPVVTKRAEEFVTRGTHDEHLQTANKRIGALEQRMTRVETKMESDKQEILDAMTEVRSDISAAVAKISGLDERTVATNAALGVQDRKLDAILSKL